MAAIHRSGNVAPHKTCGRAVFIGALFITAQEMTVEVYVLKSAAQNKKEDSIESSFSRSETDSQAALIFGCNTVKTC